MKVKIFYLLFFIFQSLNAQQKFALSTQEKDYITKFIYPLKTFNSEEIENDDLKILEKLVGKSKIIGLGEATHGSSEVYQMKYRISKYLIKNENFNLFSLEANMPESFVMNKYIIDKVADPKTILKHMYFWLWQTEETLNFVNWLKEYNDQNIPKIKFDGFDMQYTHGAIRQIKEVFQENNISTDEINELNKILKEENKGTRKYSKKGQEKIQIVLEKLKHKEISFKNEDEKKRYLQNFRIIEQKIQTGSSTERDKFMAENIKWLMKNNQDSKIIVSAHNYHVSKLDKSKMGYWLHKDYLDDYKNIGFAFYEGVYSASIDQKIGTYNSQTAYPGTLEYYLNSLNIPIFILDLKAIKNENNNLGKWILKEIPFRKTGSGTDKNEFKKTKVADSFDYLIFINKSSNSKLLNHYSK